MQFVHRVSVELNFNLGAYARYRVNQPCGCTCLLATKSCQSDNSNNDNCYVLCYDAVRMHIRTRSYEHNITGEI